MIYGLDSSSPPSIAQARAYFGQGWSFYCGYIGGNTPYSWTTHDIDNVVSQGMKFLAIWVAPYNTPTANKGKVDGAACVAALQNRRLNGTVALDVENGAVPTEYVKAFVGQLNANGFKVMLYGANATLRALGKPELVDSVWLSFWPEFEDSPGKAPYDWNIWQYMDGATADFNVARDDTEFTTVG